MHGDPEPRKPHRARPPNRQDPHAVGQRQAPHDNRLGIVVAISDDDLDTGAAQTPKLRAQKQSRVGVAQVAVVEVTGDDHHVRALVECEIDNLRQRAPRCEPHVVLGRALVCRQASEGAVEVHIGGVDDDAHDEPDMVEHVADVTIDRKGRATRRRIA